MMNDDHHHSMIFRLPQLEQTHIASFAAGCDVFTRRGWPMLMHWNRVLLSTETDLKFYYIFFVTMFLSAGLPPRHGKIPILFTHTNSCDRDAGSKT